MEAKKYLILKCHEIYKSSTIVWMQFWKNKVLELLKAIELEEKSVSEHFERIDEFLERNRVVSLKYVNG